MPQFNGKQRWGGVIAALGVLIIVAEVVFTGFILNETPRWSMILIGSGIGFVGFFMLDPKGAHEGGDLLVGYGVRILDAIPVRLGRRSSDAVVAVTPVAPPSDSRGGNMRVDDERGEHREREPV